MSTDDVEFVLRALLDCTLEQRIEVADKYLTTYNQSLLFHIQSSNEGGKWSPWAIFSAEVLISSPEQACAIYTHKLLQNSALNESTVVETICGDPDMDMNVMTAYYQQRYDQSLNDDLIGRCSPEVTEALRGFLSNKVCLCIILLYN